MALVPGQRTHEVVGPTERREASRQFLRHSPPRSSSSARVMLFSPIAMDRRFLTRWASLGRRPAIRGPLSACLRAGDVEKSAEHCPL